MSGKTEGFTIPRELLTKVEGSSLEAMFSGRHSLELKDGNPYINRDAEIFNLLLSYLRNDMMKIKIQDPVKKQLFDQEVKFWGLFNIYNKIDKRVAALMESIPKVNAKWSQNSLDVWKSLGPLDLNELHEHS